MSTTKPYKRLWRPLKGYNSLSRHWSYDHPVASLDYLRDDVFVNQAEMRSLVTTAHLIIHDLYELFNYIEPSDNNISVYSHRIFELFLRTATEFESNCKSILMDNNYPKNVKKMDILDYYKIASVARLQEYRVIFHRWESVKEFKPFDNWNPAAQAPLAWYQSYNTVKHNRYSHFIEANFGNLMNSIAGLLCILHAQCGDNMQAACYEGISIAQSSEALVETGTFTIIVPTFPEAEQYEFIWDTLKNDPTPVANYTF